MMSAAFAHAEAVPPAQIFNLQTVQGGHTDIDARLIFAVAAIAADASQCRETFAKGCYGNAGNGSRAHAFGRISS